MGTSDDTSLRPVSAIRRTLKKFRTSGSADRRGKVASAARAAIEALESRTLLSTVVVNSIADTAGGSGVVTLRGAIATANAASTPTTITFDPTVFASPTTIQDTSAYYYLDNTSAPTTIIGPAAGLTIQVAGNFNCFVIAGGSVTMENFTIADGQTTASGGGIDNYGTLTLQGMTVSNCTSGFGDGGGLENESLGTATLINDTFYDDQSIEGGEGGGVANDGVMTIYDCTITDNADIGLANAGTSCIIGNTIVSQNQSLQFSSNSADVAGTFVSAGYNFIGQVDSGSSGWNSHDLTGTDSTSLNAQLGALADNGGPTETCLPPSGSPVLAAGSIGLIPMGVTTDQRGDARTANDTVDIGSVEATTPIPAGTPAQLAIASQPTSAATGAIGTIVVDVEDPYGSIATSDNSDVVISVATGPSGATVEGTLTVQAVNGVATFNNLDLDTAGSYTLEVTDGALTAATSSTITVSAPSGLANPAALVFAQEPSNVNVDTPISPPAIVDIVDSSGSVVSSENTDVTITIESGPAGAAIPGQPMVQAGGGVATFSNLSFNLPGTYTILATDGSLAQAYSTSFTVGGGGGGSGQETGPTHLVFAQQPLGTTVGSTISPGVTVEICDNSGQIVTGDNSNITIAIAGGLGGGATLGGAPIEQADGGVATFGNLSLSKAGTYALTATDGSLTSATSALFTITNAPTVIVNPNSLATAAGQTASFTAEAVGTPPPAVQWEVSSDGGAEFATIAGATSTTYSFTTSPANDGYQYEAVFSNSLGTATTAPAALTMPVLSDPQDLAIHTGRVSLPSSIAAGSRKKASVKVIITNEGDNFSGAVNVNLFANTLTDLEGTPVSIEGMTLPNLTLKSQKSRTITFNFKTWPASLAAGNNYLVAELTMPSGATSIAATTQTVDVVSSVARPAILVDVTPPVSVFADDPSLPW